MAFRSYIRFRLVGMTRSCLRLLRILSHFVPTTRMWDQHWNSPHIPPVLFTELSDHFTFFLPRQKVVGEHDDWEQADGEDRGPVYNAFPEESEEEPNILRMADEPI